MLRGGNTMESGLAGVAGMTPMGPAYMTKDGWVLDINDIPADTAAWILQLQQQIHVLNTELMYMKQKETAAELTMNKYLATIKDWQQRCLAYEVMAQVPVVKVLTNNKAL